jgi:hypothetical protein
LFFSVLSYHSNKPWGTEAKKEGNTHQLFACPGLNIGEIP